MSINVKRPTIEVTLAINRSVIPRNNSLAGWQHDVVSTPSGSRAPWSPSRGVWSSSADVDLVIRLSHIGFDWVALDAQHGAVDRAALHALGRALASASAPFLVRVPGVDAAWIGAALDSWAAATAKVGDRVGIHLGETSGTSSRVVTWEPWAATEQGGPGSP